jgi:hypothetical protein
VPADRFFEATPQIKESLRQQVATNALELARNGIPRKPLHLSGRVGDLGVVSLLAEGDRVILSGEDGRRAEVDLGATGPRAQPGAITELPTPVTCNGVPGALADGPGVHGERAPGASPLDDALDVLDALDARDARDAHGDIVEDSREDDDIDIGDDIDDIDIADDDPDITEEVSR